MEPVDILRFAVDDRIGNVGLSPARVPLALLGEFQKDVADFLKGSSRDIDPMQVHVAIEEGSLALVASGLLTVTTLWADIGKVGQPNFMDQIDPKRAEVIERWQQAARKSPTRYYSIIDRDKKSLIKVSSDTNFHKQMEEHWVAVEKYLFGQIVDLGGVKKANVHLKLENGDTLTIEATQDLLSKEDKNRLYKPALLRITAEENLVTGELRKHRLLAFEPYEPSYDEAAFKKMVERGTRAWADVPDSATWVDDLRGGSH